MPDALTSNPEAEPSAASVTNVSGGVNLDAQRNVAIGGDVVGRDKITTIGYTVDQVSTLLTQISSTFQPKPFDGRCPYLGLDAFSEDDADRFFGRETLVSELIARVNESRFVVIAGPSGSGKSSLVRAGLIHTLKQGALPNSDRWLFATLTPGRDPIESLALALSRLAKSPDAGKYLRDHAAEPSALHEFAESQLSDRKDQRAVIFVDQFEEVFTQVSKEDERAAFLNLLTNAATIENGRVTVLFAMRSDFVSNCATYPQLNALLNQQFRQIGAMQPDELVSAIARPALQVGLRIDPDLIAQIVNDMQDEPGALPLMQFALKDLFDAQQAKGDVMALTLNDYLARGGLRKALERHADAAFAKLSEGEQQLARTIFSGLIETGRGTQDTRRTAAFNELVPANVSEAQVEAVVQKLADARLITTDEQGDRDMVTISHERLIEAWPWLHRLVNENRDAIALQNQIAEDAQEWNEHQHDASYLYSGARLATAREELTGRKIVLSDLAQKFVDAGINAYESARRRRRRIVQGVIGGLVFASLTFAGLSIWAVNSQQLAAQSAANESAAKGIAQASAEEAKHQADIAQAASKKSASAEAEAIKQRDRAWRQSQKLLAAQTSALLTDRFDLALLLSSETARLGDTYESRANLLNTLQTNPHLLGFLPGHSVRVGSVAFSPDGKTLASDGGDNSIILWNVATRQRIGEPLTGYSGLVTSVVFSPDGKTLASGSCGKFADNTCTEGEVILWDTATRQRLGEPLIGNSNWVLSLAFSPDGQTLASGGCGKFADSTCTEGEIILWDVATRQRIGEPLIGHTWPVYGVAFSPDDKTLASGSCGKLADIACIEGEVILWDVATRQRLGQPLTGHAFTVRGVAFSPDGKTLASGGEDSIILWDVATRQRIGEPLTSHSGALTSVAFSPDGKTLASGSCGKLADGICIEGEVILWDVATRQRLSEPLIGHSEEVLSVAFSPDGQTLASGSWDKNIILWNIATRQRLDEPLPGQSSMAASAAFSPDGKTLALGEADGNIILWDVATRRRLGEPLIGYSNAVGSVVFSPDGKILASGSSDNNIILWDVVTRQRIGEPLTGYRMAFSPDGKTLASLSCGKSDSICTEGEIILWDVATHQRIDEPLASDLSLMTSVAFSPDGKTLASASCGESYGPTCHKGQIILWNVATHQRIGKPLTDSSGAVTSVVFSPDGETLASSNSGNIILWDVVTRQRIGEPLIHRSELVTSLAFSPDGQTLASGGRPNSVSLWDAATRQRLAAPLIGDSSSLDVDRVAFSPDGKMLASVGSGGDIILWDVDPKSWAARACKIAGRNLTRAEYMQYINSDYSSYDTDYAANPTCPNLPVEPISSPTPIPTP